MQISTYLYVSLSAMLAWQDTQPFLCEAMETDFSVFLLTSFRCNCHTQKNHTQNSLDVLWSRELNLSTGKQDWKKEVSHPRFLWGCNQGGGVLNFFPFLLWEFKARSWPLQRPLSHLLKIKPLIPALKIHIWEPSCLHSTECIRVKNSSHLAFYLHNKHVSFKCLIWYSH